MKSKISLYFSFLLILVHTACSQTNPTNKDKLFAFMNSTEFKSASLSFVLFDLKEKKEVISYRAEKSMIPASVQKLMTTAAALEILGKNYRFPTKIFIQGSLSDRRIDGNLVLKGFGDPTAGSHYFYRSNQRFAFVDSVFNLLQTIGIEQITGAVVCNTFLFAEECLSPTWSWEDIANYYACGTYAFPVGDNLYKIHFSSPSVSGLNTRIKYTEPVIPGLTITNQVKSSAKNIDLAYLFGKPHDNRLIIRGSIPKSRADFVVKGAIPSPDWYYAFVVDSILKIKGIKINKLPERNPHKMNKAIYLGQYLSPKLAEIVYFTNKKSINLFADQLATNLCIAKGEKASLRNSAGILKAYWAEKGIDTTGMFLSDGSGLSRHNTLTANQLLFILRYMQKSANYTVFYNSLPINGKDGTLRTFGRNKIEEGRIHAKTGSFRQVHSLAGYLMADSGKQYAFVLILNNYEASGKRVKSVMEDLMAKIIKTQ